MIKKGKFKNVYGIKEFDIDFSLKHTYDDGQSEQVINVDSTSTMLVPTILAKNAAGKTSLIKAIDFAMRFSNEETFIKNIVLYKWRIASEAIARRINDAQNSTDIDTIGIEEMPIHLSSKGLIKQLFDEISFAGSEMTEIKLEMVSGDTVQIEATQKSFTIGINNKPYDLEGILKQLDFADMDQMMPKEAFNKIKSKANDLCSKINFLDKTTNFTSIYRDSKPITELRELGIKDKTNSFLNGVINKIGPEATIILMKKLDSNITKMPYDQETKTFDIYIKDSVTSISPKNLSFGTQKVIEIFYKSIKHFENGGIVMVDEIENGLHLSLIKLLVAFFEDDEINVAKAQLLLTTHNPLLAENKIIRSSNILMYEDKTFVNIKSIHFGGNSKPRRNDREKMIKAKNYYNDIFWESNRLDSKSTVSDIAINQIINAVQGGITWQQR